MEDYQVGLLADLSPKPSMFFAYDPGDAFETLESAARRMLEAGFTRESHRLRVYVMMGYPKDTFDLAEKRLRQNDGDRLHADGDAVATRDEGGREMGPPRAWRAFQRRWARPAIIHAAV